MAHASTASAVAFCKQTYGGGRRSMTRQSCADLHRGRPHTKWRPDGHNLTARLCVRPQVNKALTKNVRSPQAQKVLGLCATFYGGPGMPIPDNSGGGPQPAPANCATGAAPSDPNAILDIHAAAAAAAAPATTPTGAPQPRHQTVNGWATGSSDMGCCRTGLTNALLLGELCRCEQRCLQETALGSCASQSQAGGVGCCCASSLHLIVALSGVYAGSNDVAAHG